MHTYAHIKTKNTDGWYRVLHCDDLTTPQLSYETNTYLEDLFDMHTIALSQRLWNMPELLADMSKKSEHPKKTLEKKKVLYVNRVGGYYPDPTIDEIVEVKELPQRPLNKGVGFTGWLDSDGQFYESIYGTHNHIAWNHDIEDDEGAIYLACSESPITKEKIDLITMGSLEPTEKQLEWFYTYMDQMSTNQQRMAHKVLKGYSYGN